MRRIGLLLLLLLLSACGSRVLLISPTLPSATTESPSAIASAYANPTSTPTAHPSPTIAFPTTMAPKESGSIMDDLTITILYDNYPFDPRLRTDWGFAALIELNEYTLLFDTGANGSILMGNMDALNVDPQRIQSIVLSHEHGDHIGGIASLLNIGIQPIVYIPPSFSASTKRSIDQKTQLVEVEPGQMIHEGIYSTGEMGTSIAEQALVIRSSQGLVILTGCAHPGVAEMVARAKSIFDDPVRLVLGGFHLGQASKSRIQEIIEAFQGLGVQQVAPSHCTGDQAIALFREAYGEDFIQSGAGQVFHIGP
jgi:7,8-dihydropterin-6-yl-methyl-4-(beta-D-ribofuranosyl)aminobenzene 5'-phosphate synthase